MRTLWRACGVPCARTLAALGKGRGSLTHAARPSWEPPEAKLCEVGRGGRLLLLRSFPARFPGSLGSAKCRSSCQRAGLASVDAPRLRAGEVCWLPGSRVGGGGGVNQCLRELDFEGRRLEDFDHIPVPRKSRRGVQIPLPGSICLKQLLTVPSLAPGLCPRPEHSVLLCPRHTRSHTYTLSRGGAYTSPQHLQPAQRTAAQRLGLGLLASLARGGQSCVRWIHCHFPFSLSR